MRKDLSKIRCELETIAETEAMKLYRLAWRMQKHGCSKESIRKCRSEANELHITGRPEKILDPFRRWEYAFKY